MTDYTALRAELRAYYKDIDARAKANRERCFEALDKTVPQDLNVYDQKGMMYERIPEFVQPRLFKNTFFYYEMGTITIDDITHTTGSWCYDRHHHIYAQVPAEIQAEKNYCVTFPLYSFCGEYGDEQYHFAFNMRKVVEHGIRGLVEANESAMKATENAESKRYYANACKGLTAMKRLSERFAEEAQKLLPTVTDEVQLANLRYIARTAARVPWEAPETFREGLCALAFLQKAVPTLEGGSMYDFGRLDQILYPLYMHDLEKGIATEEELHEDLCAFMLLWNAHWDPDWKEKASEVYDSAINLAIGGCDREGKPAYNKLTMAIIRAHSEMQVIYPKLVCRFDRNAPKEYLAALNNEIARGRTAILYQNDEAFIPALVRKGVAIEDARNYSILGCWEPVIPDATNEHCDYVNLLKILEFSVFGDFSKEGICLKIQSLDGAEDFEMVYTRVVENIKAVLTSRCNAAVQGRALWSRIDPHMIYSAAIDGCLSSGRDLTAGGPRYKIDEAVCAGFPNVVDSLLAIKILCFEKKIVTLHELLEAVRNNWEGREDLRKAALRCPFFGDESAESSEMAARLQKDIACIAESLPTLYGGVVSIGYMLYMELYWWAKNMRATPDGRKTGDYFARGLTPSHLHYIPAVSSVINALNAIDPADAAANSVLNITVPYRDLPIELWDALLRTVAQSSVQALQLNCASKEELLDAQLHPEKHQNLVVRVCGFSAKFVSLSKQVQDEFLQRNFFQR